MLPDAGLGIVILTDGILGAGPFTTAVQYRLFELLFDQPAEIEPLLRQLLSEDGSQGPQPGQIDPSVVGPYLGSYTNDSLGKISLGMEGDRLIFDAGEFRSAVVPIVDESGKILGYGFTDAPMYGAPGLVMLQEGDNGAPEVVVQLTDESGFSYVFTQTGVGTMATPTP